MRLRYEREQVGHDFGFAPALIRRYFPDVEHEGSLKMVRHINVVTTYLSWMAVGEPRHYEGAMYAVALAGMDCVTDYRLDKVSEGRTARALNGDPDHPELEPMAMASCAARDGDFDVAMTWIAEWQDKSLKQFEDIGYDQLRSITKMKGGYSAIAHLRAIKGDISPSEEELMLEFGYVMQLLDDYLDQPDDEDVGISTMFTEGHIDRETLVHKREAMMGRMEDMYGESAASRRLRRILRMHTRLGDVANKTPINPEWVVPWYL